MGHKLAVAVLLLCANCVFGQTRAELESQYGKPIVAYPVSENIWMTPEYTSDGQVCMMRLHPRHFSAKANYVSARLPFQELEKVLNQLIPLQSRGAKKEPFGTGATGARVEWMSYAYENVRFTFISPFRVGPDSSKTRKTYVFTVAPGPVSPRVKESASSENDFSSTQASGVEIVNIMWNGRHWANQ